MVLRRFGLCNTVKGKKVNDWLWQKKQKQMVVLGFKYSTIILVLVGETPSELV